MNYIRRKIKRLIKKIYTSFQDIIEKHRNKKIESLLKECGKDLEIWGNPNVVFPEKLVLGNSCKINDNVYINARSGVVIGNNVTLSYGAKIISTGYDRDTFFATGNRIHREDTPIYIGDFAWLCTDAIILPGVQITGHHVIVAAGSVVNKDINDSYVIVAGNPARIVKRKEQ